MENQPPVYQSYLLRLWRASGDGEPIWRASLERAGTGERWAFANLEQLFTFLRQQAGDSAPPEEQASE
jgi:hypothetical protein